MNLIEKHQKYVAPTYGRFPLSFSRGEGRELWDLAGRRYLDCGGGIAVTSLGHAHPAMTEALAKQASQLVHVSNLYHHEGQAELAERIVHLTGPGKVFFCNSGAEANEALFKVARRHGHPQGRHEIITAQKSFHGRTLGGIAATGQEKVKTGFGPLMPGFVHVPFNDLEAVEQAISPATAAILIEGIQGEGGIHIARPEYLQGLRELADRHDLLLLWDGVQCGCFRSGAWQSFQAILNSSDPSWQPDAIAMAKSLGGGFPMGAVWFREPFQDLLGPGSHGTTFGGGPLACAAALTVLNVVEQEGLAEKARVQGGQWIQDLEAMVQRHPDILQTVRGMGYMIGLELRENPTGMNPDEAPPSLQWVRKLHENGLLTIPSGTHVVRLLPALNITPSEIREASEILESSLKDWKAS